MSVRSELNMMNELVIGTERKVDEVKSDFNHAFNTLNFKVDRDDLMKLNSRFREYVPFTEYNGLVELVIHLKFFIERIYLIIRSTLLLQNKEMEAAMGRLDDLNIEVVNRYAKHESDQILKNFER